MSLSYEVMQRYVMHKPANDPIFTFIEKKRSEEKYGKLAMVAGLNKFLRIYYGKVTELYRSSSAIELISPILYLRQPSDPLCRLCFVVLFFCLQLFLIKT